MERHTDRSRQCIYSSCSFILREDTHWMNQGKRQCLSVLPTPPPTSTWVKWNVKEEGKRVRSWDGPRKWNSPYLTLDPGSSYLVLDFWRPKAAHSPGPSLTEALAKSGASVRNTTQSLFARNSLWRWSRRRCQMQEEETLSGKTSRVKWRLSWSILKCWVTVSTEFGATSTLIWEKLGKDPPILPVSFLAFSNLP